MRDLQTSFHALTGSHPRRSFRRRAPGQLAKRCIRNPASNPAPGGNSTSASSGSTSTSTRSSTRGSTSRGTTGTSTVSSASNTASAPTSTYTTTLTSPTTSAPTPTSTWKIQTTMSGDDFFDSWNFWAEPDITNGAVDYQTESGAQSAGLVSVNSAGHAIMRIESTPTVAANRKSVRIHSKYTLNGGLVILDAVHMPYGCGTWPAFWSSGDNWPTEGEIDILEGINGYTQNQASLHTSPGCTIPQNYGSSGVLAATLDCDQAATGNQGCGQLSSQANNYGKAFNDNGGGVYAMKWDTSGVSVFFFPREAIPSDITSGAPQPSTWGTPAGNWPALTCDPFKFMKDHMLIFDTTLCGDWAGSAWQTSNVGGQATSCAASTGYSNCLDYVRNNGAAFSDAYWEVKSVKVYT
ncbi:hypothetical protein BDV93DRAFT_456685 [Ceratobasidium sp. AG-I]|nr:hypothetical protein BDV93DRAFT_456685 [Ceratobasidium sp. AG-I]